MLMIGIICLLQSNFVQINNFIRFFQLFAIVFLEREREREREREEGGVKYIFMRNQLLHPPPERLDFVEEKLP